MEKVLWMLKSRKFWSAVVGLLVAFGVLEFSDAQEAEMVQAILTVMTAIGYSISVAVEDAGRHQGEGAALARPDVTVVNTPPAAE